MTNPVLVCHESINIIGIQIRTSNQQEKDQTTGKIPQHWQRFFTENIASKIPNKINQTQQIALYTEYEGDHTGEYSLIIGVPVTTLQTIPTGMVGMSITPSTYSKFTYTGKMPDIVIMGWENIWDYFSHNQNNQSHKRTFHADFELYDSAKPDCVEIYIGVREF